MTAKVLQRPTLILNRNWQPVNVAPVARALVLLWNASSRVVDPADYQTYTWNDWSRLCPKWSRLCPKRMAIGSFRRFGFGCVCRR
jgi:hypothetical protein